MKTNNKLHKAITLAVATINTMNAFVPAAIPAIKLAEDVRQECAQSFDTNNIIAGGIQVVDSLFFATAEAYTTSVGNGMTVNDEQLNNNEQQTIYNGGTAINTTVNSNGAQTILNGGLANSATINSGGTQWVSGGIASNTMVNNGIQHILNGGTANGTTLNNGTQRISNGVANNTTINSGSQIISGGCAANDTIIGNNGRQDVSTGATANNTTINSGGSQSIWATATVDGVTINSGGTCNANGTVTNIQQMAGGVLNLSVVGGNNKIVSGTYNGSSAFSLSNGVANGLVLEKGGSTNVLNGGIANNTTINGGSHTVQNAVVNNTTINGGSQWISKGGIANDTTINSGGVQLIRGTVSNTTINSGGHHVMFSGGTSTDIQQMAGAVINVGVIGGDNVTLVNGIYNGSAAFSLSGGVADGFVLESSGLQSISAGGVATNTTINNLGSQSVSSGGTASNTTVNSGGTQSVLSGGLASKIVINAGGTQLIQNKASDKDSTINSGGTQRINSNGVANNTLVAGTQNVNNGAFANGATIDSGGLQIVASGGTSQDTSVKLSGSLQLQDGAVVVGTINNSGQLNAGDYKNNTAFELSGTDGVVDIMAAASTTYDNKLNLSKLSGSQTFNISADLASNKADRIVINNSADGTHYIRIVSEASNVSNLFDLTGKAIVVEGNGAGNATFAGARSDIQGVSIMPTITKDGDNWILTEYSKLDNGTPAGASKLAITAHGAVNIAYSLILATDNNMQRRMGELRDNINNAGIWVRTYGGEYAAENITAKQFTIQGGYDWVRPVHNGQSVTGITVEHQNASNSYDTGSGKLTNTRFGIYHSWLGDSGHYYDIVAKAGRMNNKFDVYGDTGKINSDYSIWNTTLSAEYGYTKQLQHGYYITPQVELVYSRVNGANYTASNNTSISQDTINSLIARIGISAGRKLEKVNYYVTASLLHEFMAKSNVTTGIGEFASTLQHDLKGTAVELAIGGSVKLGKNSNTYLEASRSFGGKVTNKWQLQAGYRYNF